MILVILMMMKNNNNFFGLIISSFSNFFFEAYKFSKFFFIYVFGWVFSILSAFFNSFKYIASFFGFSSKLNISHTSAFMGQIEIFLFPTIFGLYSFFSSYFKSFLFFLSFIVPFFFILHIELSNESLLLGCIIFTIFLLYNSAKDLMIGALASDISNMRALTQKKLDLLSKIYTLEYSMIEQQSSLISSIEDCVSKLSLLEANSQEIDSTIFENLLNQTFSESLFDYYVVELKDEFYKEYFFIEENFEESSFRFIEENFLLLSL
jgi:hypothetical protein